eukprot:TRINITY_DN17695_c0_g1_i1.p1 TRINITY_DN17695_c0_g1~~TRINITY_DN17695_c0_g1_i1.p1  ORF type:complete len:253 (-),score=27.37 TRINITY_DN17695_c0_g1_i1:42-800(-)
MEAIKKIQAAFDDYDARCALLQEFPNICEGLCARVTRGGCEADFEKLTRLHWKPFAWTIGPDGLKELLECRTQLHMAYLLGFQEQWLQEQFDRQREFRLAVFTVGATSGRQATWDGVFEMCRLNLPEPLAAKLLPHKEDIINTPITELEEQQGQKYLDVNLRGEEDPLFYNLIRWEEAEGKLWQARGFLYHTVGLNDLFAGDGYTKDAEGKKGTTEFLVANKRVEELDNFHWIQMKGLVNGAIEAHKSTTTQ